MKKKCLPKTLLVISASVVVALWLALLPLPDLANWLRPLWVPLVVIYWAMALPERMSVTLVWMLGLLMDQLSGGLLGQHALALVLMTYVVLKLYSRIRLFPLSQQAICVGFLLLAYQLLLWWIQGLSGLTHNTWKYWMPIVTSALLWPWIFVLLRDYRRRFNLQR